MKTPLLKFSAFLLLAVPSADVLAVTLSMPNDLTAQRGDLVSVPMFISDGSLVTDIAFGLDVDFTRLVISGGTVNPALAGATLTVTTAGSGTAATATVFFHDAHALPAGLVELGELVSSVVNTAPFGPTTLHFNSSPLASINAGEIAVGTVDGVVTIVPEPSSLVLGLFAAAGLALAAIRKRRARR